VYSGMRIILLQVNCADGSLQKRLLTNRKMAGYIQEYFHTERTGDLSYFASLIGVTCALVRNLVLSSLYSAAPEEVTSLRNVVCSEYYIV
jgi:hypothetical protein